MTLGEAKACAEAFQLAHGARLRALVNDSPTLPDKLVVDRDTFEAIEQAFQHWPMRDEHGEEFVGNCCHTDPELPFPNVMFKGIPVTYDVNHA